MSFIAVAPKTELLFSPLLERTKKLTMYIMHTSTSHEAHNSTIPLFFALYIVEYYHKKL